MLFPESPWCGGGGGDFPPLSRGARTSITDNSLVSTTEYLLLPLLCTSTTRPHSFPRNLAFLFQTPREMRSNPPTCAAHDPWLSRGVLERSSRRCDPRRLSCAHVALFARIQARTLFECPPRYFGLPLEIGQGKILCPLLFFPRRRIFVFPFSPKTIIKTIGLACVPFGAVYTCRRVRCRRNVEPFLFVQGIRCP